jgi:hypothetical protein
VPAPGWPAEHRLGTRGPRFLVLQDISSGNLQDRGVKQDYSPRARKVAGDPSQIGVNRRLYG